MDGRGWWIMKVKRRLDEDCLDPLRLCIFDGQNFDSWKRNDAGYKAQRYSWRSAVVTRDFGEIQSNPFSAKLILGGVQWLQEISGNCDYSPLIKSMRLESCPRSSVMMNFVFSVRGLRLVTFAVLHLLGQGEGPRWIKEMEHSLYGPTYMLVSKTKHNVFPPHTLDIEKK
ncbi:hypothetical protein F2Q68_00029736 [Brassica cretica]|uniref:Uncharacterized protein n=1 Tax=Brassica cretica TaxID=69181 RepID=A0A8S9GD36_BRACR|nr:hypothetical protein F2Q68_00029736 [Brassica cretica]